ncbi:MULTISPECIES: hypothetical protein [unclassified Streptomyces]|uniref:hypothetical protein n=1 Tax=unclassified Streptomyces TaxID=2593676 RepID=UPI000B87F17E|nr:MULTISPECIES: hypothetical protein [unclassified Streptomyces]MYZ36307.1 hypothetical protein [Streptomyces sp. SID4917]
MLVGACFAFRWRPWNRASNSSSSRKLLGYAHIGVTADIYAHVRLRLQRQAIDLLNHALGDLGEAAVDPGDGDDLPIYAATVR